MRCDLEVALPMSDAAKEIVAAVETWRVASGAGCGLAVCKIFEGAYDGLCVFRMVDDKYNPGSKRMSFVHQIKLLDGGDLAL